MVQPNVMPPWGAETLRLAAIPGSLPSAQRRGAVRATQLRSEHGMAISPLRSAGFPDSRAALMAAAQAGDATAYASLLRDCVPLIRAIARRCGVPADRLDDAVQEVLLTVHRARATYDPGRPFDAWLRVIAERRSIDLMRRTIRHGGREIHAPQAFEDHADDTADPARGLEQADAAGRVGQAMAALSERQREAVHHLVLKERSLAETAAATGRSTGSLKVNLHRALKALRVHLEGKG
jgi:RNA polymerase sigma-70 factor (ECF subfamily)